MADVPASPGPFFDVLEIQDDDVLIVTLLLDRLDGHLPVLRHGTAIFAPLQAGDLTWGLWSAEQTRIIPSLCPAAVPSQFVHDAGTWLGARAVLDGAHAVAWLATLPQAAQSTVRYRWPADYGLPEFEAKLEAPKSVIRILPGTDVPTSSFLASAHRPALGTVWTAQERDQLRLPNLVDVDGAMCSPLSCMLGMTLPTQGMSTATPPPFGLFVGCLERRAWLTDFSGDGHEYQSLQVQIGWDPTYIDLTDLVLDLEQFIDGNLVNQLRAPIEDTEIAEEVLNAGACTVGLPTFGSGVASTVSLSTRDGALLDRIGPHHLVESIQIAMTTNGVPQPPIVIGSAGPPPGLEDRAVRQRQVAKQIEELAAQGASARQLVDREAAQQRLRQEIARARGELLVHDRYFGQDSAEWRLLDDAPVPVRVLTGKIAAGVTPTIANHVSAKFRRKAEMHERFWIWDGGGFSLGGSPTTFGNAPVWIRRLPPADVDLMRSVFEGLWTSEHFHEVPRSSE